MINELCAMKRTENWSSLPAISMAALSWYHWMERLRTTVNSRDTGSKSIHSANISIPSIKALSNTYMDTIRGPSQNTIHG